MWHARTRSTGEGGRFNHVPTSHPLLYRPHHPSLVAAHLLDSYKAEVTPAATLAGKVVLADARSPLHFGAEALDARPEEAEDPAMASLLLMEQEVGVEAFYESQLEYEQAQLRALENRSAGGAKGQTHLNSLADALFTDYASPELQQQQQQQQQQQLLQAAATAEATTMSSSAAMAALATAAVSAAVGTAGATAGATVLEAAKDPLLTRELGAPSGGEGRRGQGKRGEGGKRRIHPGVLYV